MPQEPQSFAEIYEAIERAIKTELNTADVRATANILASLRFDINRIIKKQQLYAMLLRERTEAQPMAQLPAGVTLPRMAVVDARDAQDAMDGFYPIEHGENAAYRWTGPKPHTTFRLWIDRSCPIRLTVNIHSFGDVRNKTGISLLVDGEPVALECTESRIQSEAIQARPGIRATEIVIFTPYSFKPSEQGDDDPRELRIAFTRLIAHAEE